MAKYYNTFLACFYYACFQTLETFSNTKNLTDKMYSIKSTQENS